MKYVLSAGVAAFLVLGSLMAFWRVHGLEARELGVLTGGVDALSSRWQADRVPALGRVVSLIISDADSGADPFVPAAEPGSLDLTRAWFSRSIVGGGPVAVSPTPFAAAFMVDPNVVAWTHAGFSAVSEEAMLREVMKAMVKAHDAGAEVDIVAQGASAGPVLAALKRLQGVERGGVKVGASKVLVVGQDPLRLRRIADIASYDFTQPGNVIELANIWSPGGLGGARVWAHGAGMKGVEFNAVELWPLRDFSGAGFEQRLFIVRELMMTAPGMEKTLGRLADAAEQRRKTSAAAYSAQAEAAKTAVTVKSHDGFYRQKAAGGDSLSMVKGGGNAGEARTGAQDRPSEPAERRSGECAEYSHVRCCTGSMSRVRARDAHEACYPILSKTDHNIYTYDQPCAGQYNPAWTQECQARHSDYRACVGKHGCGTNPEAW